MISRLLYCMPLLILCLQGCSFFKASFPLFNKDQSSAGPKPIFESKDIESIDLKKFIAETGFSLPNYKGDGSTTEFQLPVRVPDETDIQVSVNGEMKTLNKDYYVWGAGKQTKSVVHFTSPPARDSNIYFFITRSEDIENEVDLVRLYNDLENRFASNPTGLKRQRNQIQERILMASNSRCTQYKTFLMQFESEGNFFWGAASVITGGLGAIFTPAATARALAGAAGITGGMHAEWQQDFFHKLTTQVIMSGIEAKRLGLYKKILVNQGKSYDDYTLMAAINDAVQYHGACSLVDGLQEAGDAVRQTQDVGFSKLQEYLKAAGMKATPLNLFITPSGPVSLSTNTSLEFAVTGGTGKVTFSIQGDTSGGAVIDQVSGKFNAGSKTGAVTVRATDQQGTELGVAVAITPKFEFNPLPALPAKGHTYDISVKGGTPPYTFQLKQNNSNAQLLQALPPSPSDTIRYISGTTTGTDIIEATDKSTVQQTIPLPIPIP